LGIGAANQAMTGPVVEKLVIALLFSTTLSELGHKTQGARHSGNLTVATRFQQAQMDCGSAEGHGLVDELDRALGQDKLTDRRVK
jgi:hypothetical protein